MNRVFLVIFLISVLVSRCSTKESTFYDIDKNQIIGNSNKIFVDSNLKCFATFLLYSETNSPKKYAGILVDLAITKDSAVKIEKAEVKISPTKNGKFINPESYMSSNMSTSETVNGNEFDSVKSIANKYGSDGIAMFFKTNIKQYDSLYLELYINYMINERYFEIRKSNTYVKEYFKQQLTR